MGVTAHVALDQVMKLARTSNACVLFPEYEVHVDLRNVHDGRSPLGEAVRGSWNLILRAGRADGLTRPLRLAWGT